MDKLLEFIVAYVKDIFNTKDDDSKINKKQLALLLCLLIFLTFISILGYNDGGSNLVLKDYAVFSFYTSIIVVIMFIVGFGGYKKGVKEDNLKKFNGKTELIKQIIPYKNHNKNILVLLKENSKYEFNLWVNEEDNDFGKFYIYFPRHKTNSLKEKFLKLNKSPFSTNESFSEDSLVYDYDFKNSDLDGSGEKIKTVFEDAVRIIKDKSTDISTTILLSFKNIDDKMKSKDITDFAVNEYGKNKTSVMPADYVTGSKNQKEDKQILEKGEGTGMYILSELGKKLYKELNS